jgi:hypothetical protein
MPSTGIGSFHPRSPSLFVFHIMQYYLLLYFISLFWKVYHRNSSLSIAFSQNFPYQLLRLSRTLLSVSQGVVRNTRAKPAVAQPNEYPGKYYGAS